MPLSNEQVKNLYEAKPLKTTLEKAKNHELRLEFHTETVLSKHDLGRPWSDFIRFIGTEKPVLLNKGKVDRIVQLIQTPLPTLELTESIFSKLGVVFEAQDKFEVFKFKNDKHGPDYSAYRDNTFWEVQGFRALQNAINSFWVVDFPTEQTDEFPQPVNKLVDVADVIDTYIDENNNCHYLIFQEENYIYTYDEQAIRTYEIVNGMFNTNPIYEFNHGLGVCPARSFWSKNLWKKDNINKESPLTKVLADLDWLLFHMASKKYLDIANAYPMLITYAQGGDYTDDSQTENKQLRSEPEGGSNLGPGTILEVDVPEEGMPDLMSNPAKYINPPVDSLDWHVAEEERLKAKIYKSVVGVNSVNLNDSAKNEKQIDSVYESQMSVLNQVKNNFEIINNFAETIICKLRYGDSFESCHIDYGTRFFLKSINDLYEDYSLAKEAGAGDYLLSEIEDSIISTKFRDDKKSISRAKIINDIDPLPQKTTKEAIDIFSAGGIDKINFVIKINLLNFVKRFERENGSIVVFGENIDYGTKIENILNTFKTYADERTSISSE